MSVFLAMLAAMVALILMGAGLYRRNMHIWLGSYLRQWLSRTARGKALEPVHVIFCFVDHFEPLWRNADPQLAWNRIQRWVQQYPSLADGHRDGDGVVPQHTFFYPQEEYRPELLEALAGLCHRGYGEVEIHLHHHDDAGPQLRAKLEAFKQQLLCHRLLCRNERDGRVQYGFIHGNWALDNSRRDGKWCGVNDELLILSETDCYADFTLPTAPSDTQTKKINAIYYASDHPRRPKSHNTGVDVQVGKRPWGDLMIVQGPLWLNWRNRKWGLLPRIESGEIKGDSEPTAQRADLWTRPRVQVRGNPHWIFVKIFTHGAQERNERVLLGKPMDDLFSYLERRYNDGRRYKLHYVTAREMYNIIKAAEEGQQGDPHQYRDYLLRSLADLEAPLDGVSGSGKGCENQNRTGGEDD